MQRGRYNKVTDQPSNIYSSCGTQSSYFESLTLASLIQAQYDITHYHKKWKRQVKHLIFLKDNPLPSSLPGQLGEWIGVNHTFL